jgi:hypothetical protein
LLLKYSDAQSPSATTNPTSGTPGSVSIDLTSFPTNGNNMGAPITGTIYNLVDTPTSYVVALYLQAPDGSWW